MRFKSNFILVQKKKQKTKSLPNFLRRCIFYKLFEDSACIKMSLGVVRFTKGKVLTFMTKEEPYNR